MRTKFTVLFIGFFLLILAGNSNLSAQVTIGSGEEPVNGALLDLKENAPAADNTTAKKGLALPRVGLSEVDQLYPMFLADPNNPASGPNTDYTTNKATRDMEHTGLTVYNLNKCLTVSPGKGGPGAYVWSGSQWQYIGTPKDLQGSTLELLSSLYSTTDASGNLRIDIPSGLDARGTTVSPFDLTVSSDPLASLASPIDNTYNGGIAFSPAQAWTTGALTASPMLYSGLQTTDMSSGTGAVTAAAPWTTRQTVLTFSGSAGCPPVAASRTVTLNQTNYAILAYNNVNPNVIGTASNFITLRNTNASTFRITSNVAWKATVTETKDILDHTIPATGGADNSANGSSSANYTLTGKNTANTKYGTATILLEDNTAPKRAKDYTVTVMQCQGTEDLSGVMTATDNNDPNWQTNWGTNVVHHPAKAGVYEEFYSAYFGAAGRWMTTNLAAVAYDGIRHSTDDGTATSGSGNPRTLTGPNVNSGSPNNTAYWCYPGGGTNNTNYLNNPQIGYLYTWDAATAGKGGASGTGNSQNEGGLPYGTSTLPDGSTITVTQIQGVCPAGWHLPSDYEWSQLEQAIYESPQLYSSYTDNSSFPQPVWDPAWNTSNSSRPATGSDAQGKAMKEVCGLNNQVPNGLSNSITNGGFSVLLVGIYTGVLMNAFGTGAGLNSSSSVAGTGLLYRSLGSTSAGVNRYNVSRYGQYSVRCKKD